LDVGFFQSGGSWSTHQLPCIFLFGLWLGYCHRWVEYEEPIDLMTQPLHMEIEKCWYQNSNGSNWAYDLTNYMMMILDAIVFLALRTCFPMYEKMFQ
jgi:hypothetical protein